MNEPVSIIRRVCLGAGYLLAVGAAALARAQQEPIQPPESIRRAAESFVRAQIPASGQQSDVQAGALDARLRLAPCDQPLAAALPPGATLRARTTVGVSCHGSRSWTVYVPVSIESTLPVLVLKQAMARGARVGEADVEVQSRKVSGTDVGYLTNVTQLTGRTLKRPLAAGVSLTADAFMDDLVIRRGQQVTLLASVGGLEIRARGTALADAPAAGRVRVQNANSLQVVEGVVESGDVIRVTP